MLFNRCESTNVNEPQLYWAFSVSTSTRSVPLSKSEVFTELCAIMFDKKEDELPELFLGGVDDAISELPLVVTTGALGARGAPLNI